jgi:hypothetical protein
MSNYFLQKLTLVPESCIIVASVTFCLGLSFAARSEDFVPSVQASASQGSSNVTVKLSPKNPTPDMGLGNNEFALNVPTAKTSDTSTPATLDGLANSATLSWTISQSGLLDDNKRPPADKEFYAYGLKLQGGPQPYTYYDKTSLAKSSGHNPTSALSIYAGLTWLNTNNVMTLLKYSYQNTYKDQTIGTMCPGGGGTATCVNGPIGAPSHALPRVITLETRIQSISGISTIVALSHDEQSNVTGIDIPIYLWGSNDLTKPQAFNAGVDLGWTNDPKSAHQGMISIFIGKPFSFYGF